MFWNGNFDEGVLQPWAPNFAFDGSSVAIENGEACLNVVRAGQNPYDVVFRQQPVSIGLRHKLQLRFKAHSTPPTKVRARVVSSEPGHKEYWSADAAVGVAPQVFTGSFDGPTDDYGADFTFHLGGALAGQTPFKVCFDDIELNDPKFEIPAGRIAAASLEKVRVNQVGYLPQYHKIATVKSNAKEPLEWQIVDASGKVVASGKTKPFGEDKAAGELAHTLDFSSFRTPGKGYKLLVGRDQSAPFAIGADIYHKLQYDALAFFYHQRSGVPIEMPYAGGPQWARPPGHVGDKNVACAPGTCDYSLDVSGGWYDAGDHGKYVVNAGISVWTLQNEYERAKYLGKNIGELGDGKMNIPENKNGKPDILDEARFEIEWMLKMQVPQGKPHAGMAHQRMHSETWTPIPTRPDQDAVKRYLRKVATAATLNLSASAAQAARLWKDLDPAFAKKCLDAAEVAWKAAKKEPNVVAEGMGEGGGAYGDSDFTDEFYWAAAELFITTGNAEYRNEYEGLPVHGAMNINAGGGSASMSWDHVETLGKISLAIVPSKLDKAKVDELRKQILGAANTYLGYIEKRAYRVPLVELQYAWGSNSFIMNDMIILGLAFDLSKDVKYVNGVVDSMDYILGRNPKVKSYVSGYGTRALENPHHRFWAHQKDPKLPSAPPGAVSGGPNSNVQDPYAKSIGLPGCAGETCYVDHIESWSTNEVAINWNAPLAWAAAFLDDVAR
jgi:endoglucanase